MRIGGWSSDVCSSDLRQYGADAGEPVRKRDVPDPRVLRRAEKHVARQRARQARAVEVVAEDRDLSEETGIFPVGDVAVGKAALAGGERAVARPHFPREAIVIEIVDAATRAAHGEEGGHAVALAHVDPLSA